MVTNIKLNDFETINHKLHQHLRRHESRVGIILTEIVPFIPKKIADAYRLTDEALVKAFCDGGYYHDIGKVIYEQGLFRTMTGKLNETTIEALRQHPLMSEKYLLEYADQIFRNDEEKQIRIDMAKYHHERVDGTGYPLGLTGDEIPFAAQLCSLVNVFDNLIMNSRNVEGRRLYFGPAYEKVITDIGRAGNDALKCFIDAKEILKRYYTEKRLNV